MELHNKGIGKFNEISWAEAVQDMINEVYMDGRHN